MSTTAHRLNHLDRPSNPRVHIPRAAARHGPTGLPELSPPHPTPRAAAPPRLVAGALVVLVVILVVPAVLSLVGAFQWPAWASWSLMVLGLIGLVLGALVVWPKALVPRVAGATALERAKLQNDARTSLVSGTTIATALLAAVLAWNQLAGTRADSLEQQRRPNSSNARPSSSNARRNGSSGSPGSSSTHRRTTRRSPSWRAPR